MGDTRRASGRTWPIIAAVGSALILLALVVGLTRSWSSPEASTTTGFRPSDPRIGLELYQPGERAPLPELTGNDLNGQPLTTTAFAGKLLVVNVWGSWCAPCRAEAPTLAKAAEQNSGRGVRFVGIDTRDNPASGTAFARQYGITYPSFDDTDGTVLLELDGLVPVSAVPSTLFVDVDGGIAARVIGQIDASTLRGILDDLLAERDAGRSAS